MSKAVKKSKLKRAPPRRAPPPNIVIRNGAPAPGPAPRPPKPQKPRKPSLQRYPLKYRVGKMGGSHVAAGIGAGAVGNVIGVIAVGKGWVGPKTSAGILMGTGAATTAAGFYWEADHVMAAGVGLTAAGTFSLANLFAVDGYEASERKAKEKKEAKEKEAAASQEAKDKAEREARLADARAQLEAEEAKRKGTRNATRLVIVAQPDDGDDGEVDEDSDDRPIDYEGGAYAEEAA